MSITLRLLVVQTGHSDISFVCKISRSNVNKFKHYFKLVSPNSSLSERLGNIYGQTTSPALTAFISSDETWFESLKEISMNFKREKSSWMVTIGPESQEVSRIATSSNEAIILQVKN